MAAKPPKSPRLKSKLVIRDSMALLNGQDMSYSFDTGIDIVGPDNRTLFTISLCRGDPASIDISAGDVVKLTNGRLLNDSFVVSPVATNRIKITKPDYKP